MICWDAVVAAFFCGGGFFSCINRKALCEYKSAIRPEFTPKIIWNLCCCTTIIFRNFLSDDIRINLLVEFLRVYLSKVSMKFVSVESKQLEIVGVARSEELSKQRDADVCSLGTPSESASLHKLSFQSFYRCNL